MHLVLTRSSPKGNGLLLPVLERFSLVEVLHPVEHSRHHLSSVSLVGVSLANSVPELKQSSLLVGCDHLLISAS